MIVKTKGYYIGLPLLSDLDTTYFALLHFRLHLVPKCIYSCIPIYLYKFVVLIKKTLPGGPQKIWSYNCVDPLNFYKAVKYFSLKYLPNLLGVLSMQNITIDTKTPVLYLVLKFSL